MKKYYKYSRKISYSEAAEKLETNESEKFAKNIAKQIRYGVQKDLEVILTF